MTDAALPALSVVHADELESPARRALRRLFKRKGAVLGLVVIATFLVLPRYRYGGAPAETAGPIKAAH